MRLSDGPKRGLAGGLGTDYLKQFGQALTSLKRFHLFCGRGFRTVFDRPGLGVRASPWDICRDKAQ